MKKLSSAIAILFVIGSLTACTNRELATTGGAVVGGVAGNAITGGSGLGTVAGAVGGGVIGNQLAR